MTEEEELLGLIRQKLYHRNEAQAVRIIEQYKSDIIKKIKKQLTIPNVSKCNELLCDFLMQYDDNITIYDAEVEASTFIQMQKHNCG